MAACFTFLLNQLRTATGDIPSGKVYFYEPGTTTAKTVWMDKDMVTVAANPYPLSANSQCQIYGIGMYHVVIKSTDLVTLYDWDNVEPLADDFTVTPDGNVDPGTTDMTAAIQAAADAVKNTGKTLRFKPETYLISDTVIFEGCNVEFEDPYYSRILCTTELAPAVILVGTRKTYRNINVWFQLASPATSAIGIRFGADAADNLNGDANDHFSNNLVEQCYVRYAFRSFVNATTGHGNIWNNTFINCRSDFATDYAWYFGQLIGNTTQTWINCMVDGVFSGYASAYNAATHYVQNSVAKYPGLNDDDPAKTTMMTWISKTGTTSSPNEGNTPELGDYWTPFLYHASETYPLGQLIEYGGSVWKSKVANNIGNTPQAGASWELYSASKGWLIDNVEDVAWHNCQCDDMPNGNAIFVTTAASAHIDNFRTESGVIAGDSASGQLIFVNAFNTKIDNLKIQATNLDGMVNSVIRLGATTNAIIGNMAFQAVTANDTIHNGTFCSVYKVNANGLSDGYKAIINTPSLLISEVYQDTTGTRTTFANKTYRRTNTSVAPVDGTFEAGDELPTIGVNATARPKASYVCTRAGTLGTISTTATTVADSRRVVVAGGDYASIKAGQYIYIPGVYFYEGGSASQPAGRVLFVTTEGSDYVLYMHERADISQTATATYYQPTFSVDRTIVLKGTTTERNDITLGSDDNGIIYLDTTLDADGLPVIWQGAKWIKFDGTDA